MTALTVLVAVSGAREASLVTELDRSPAGLRVVRRCADLGELLSAASAGLARAAIVSQDFRRLDREAVTTMLSAGVAVVGLVEAGDDQGADLMRGLGVGALVTVPADADSVADAVRRAVESLAAVATTPGTLPRADDVEDGDRTGGDGADGSRGDTAGAGPRRFPAPAGPAGPRGPRGPGVPGGTGSPPGGPPSGPPPGGAHRRSGGDAPAGTTRPSQAAPGHVVAVWGPTGAPGRTTVATTLAAEFAVLGMETLLVDADTYGASVAHALGMLDESAGLAAATRAANAGRLDGARLAALAPEVGPGLRVLTGLPQPGRWPELRPAALQVVWSRAAASYPWTVVDCGFALDADEELSFDTAVPRRNGATLSALAAADVVVAVGSCDPVGLQRLIRGLADLSAVMPSAAAPPRVVVTRVRSAAVGPSPADRVTSALTRYAGVRTCVLVPDDRAACDAAMLAGRTLTEHAPSSPARLALARLAADLSGFGQPRRGRLLHRGRRRAALPGR